MKKIVATILSCAVLTASAGLVYAVDAKAVFKKKCKSCHNITAKKKVGPGLKGVFGRTSKVAGKMDEAGLRKWLTDPKAVYKKSKMAKMMKKKPTAEEIEALITYLKTL